MQGLADLTIFVNAFFSSVLSPMWALWTGGSILSISLLIWLVRQIVKSIRKIY